MKIKTIITTLSMVFFFSIVKSQEYHFTSKIKVHYDMYLNFNGIKKYKAVLYANNKIAYTKYYWVSDLTGDKPRSLGNGINKQIKFRDSTIYYIITDTKNDLIYSLRKKFKNGQLYYLKEKKTNFNWKITNQVKEIQNIKCHLAHVKFRGRSYSVWYAPSIPIRYGPYKFNGLPGLIIEVKDSQNEVVFKTTKIEFTATEIDVELNPSYKILNLGEYLNLRKKRLSAIKSKLNRFKSRMPKGIKVDVEDINIHEIETDYNYEETY